GRERQAAHAAILILGTRPGKLLLRLSLEVDPDLWTKTLQFFPSGLWIIWIGPHGTLPRGSGTSAPRAASPHCRTGSTPSCPGPAPPPGPPGRRPRPACSTAATTARSGCTSRAPPPGT